MDTMTEQHTPQRADEDKEIEALVETNKLLADLGEEPRARVLAFLNARHAAPRTPRAAGTSRRPRT